MLLINNGKGAFTNAPATLSAGLDSLGMVTDAAWIDIDGDSTKELLVCGEWMKLHVFSNKNGAFSDVLRSIFGCFNGWESFTLGNGWDGIEI